MTKRRTPQRKALGDLLNVYAPPRKVRILYWNNYDDNEVCGASNHEQSNVVEDLFSGGSKTTETKTVKKASTADPVENATPSHRDTVSVENHSHDTVCTVNACNSRLVQPDEPYETSSASDKKRQHKEEKKLEKRRWVGSVVEALSDVFSALWTNFIEPSIEFQTSSRLRPGGGKPGTDANLVSKAFTTSGLLASSRGFRIHFRLMNEFDNESFLPDWENNPAVSEYTDYMKSDKMIRECCLGLHSRLGTPQLETVDQFVDTLRRAWFQEVPGPGGKPRCGYRHVCIGEFHPRSGTLSGMHNWFKFLIEEERNNTRILNWWSYQKDLHLISLKFSMKQQAQSDAWFTKPRSSFLVGVPADFELLLFTVVTIVNPNQDTAVHIKDYEPLVVVPRSLKKTGGVVTAYFRESPKPMCD